MDADLERAELAVARTQWGGIPGATVREVGELLVVAAPGPPWMTQVVGAALAPGDLAAALDLVPSAVVTVPDGAIDAESLRGLGLRAGVRLVRLSTTPQPGELPAEVVVAGHEDRDRVAAVARAGFGLDLPDWWTAPLGRPGWTQVLLVREGAAVATGGLHVADGVGRLGAATTLPAARGRGAQSALIAARCALAAGQGARLVTVTAEPGSASLRNLRRAGFVERCTVTQWAR